MQITKNKRRQMESTGSRLSCKLYTQYLNPRNWRSISKQNRLNRNVQFTNGNMILIKMHRKEGNGAKLPDSKRRDSDRRDNIQHIANKCPQDNRSRRGHKVWNSEANQAVFSSEGNIPFGGSLNQECKLYIV